MIFIRALLTAAALLTPTVLCTSRLLTESNPTSGTRSTLDRGGAVLAKRLSGDDQKETETPELTQAERKKLIGKSVFQNDYRVPNLTRHYKFKLEGEGIKGLEAIQDFYMDRKAESPDNVPTTHMRTERKSKPQSSTEKQWEVFQEMVRTRCEDLKCLERLLTIQVRNLEHTVTGGRPDVDVVDEVKFHSLVGRVTKSNRKADDWHDHRNDKRDDKDIDIITIPFRIDGSDNMDDSGFPVLTGAVLKSHEIPDDWKKQIDGDAAAQLASQLYQNCTFERIQRSFGEASFLTRYTPHKGVPCADRLLLAFSVTRLPENWRVTEVDGKTGYYCERNGKKSVIQCEKPTQETKYKCTWPAKVDEDPT